MTCKELTPVLMVEDVNNAIDFYLNVLGFDFVIGVPEKTQEVVPTWSNDRVLDFAIMKCGNAEIMFQSRRSMAEPEELPEFKDKEIGGSFCLYIEVDNVQDIYDKVKGKIPLHKDLKTQFYGMREFHVKDCNGYILGFAERLNMSQEVNS